MDTSFLLVYLTKRCLGNQWLFRDQSSLKTSDGEAAVEPEEQLKADMLAKDENVDWINPVIDNTGICVTVSDPKYRFLIGKPVSEERATL